MSSATETAPDVRETHCVTYAAAARMVEAGLARGAEIDCPVSVAVVDPGGHLLAFGRHDGGIICAVDLAIRKAVTAVTVGASTAKLWERLEPETVLVEGLASGVGLLAVPGGLPLEWDGSIAGGVGVSGGHHSEDAKVAEAAILAFSPSPD